jgi:lipoprotein NlpI
MNQGDWNKAAEGFNAYIKSRTQFSVYDLIKGDIIAQQANTQPWPLGKHVSTNNKWEQTLFDYWQARTSADDLKKIALTRCEKTEYFFYTGYQDLHAGITAQAHTKFKAAIDQNTYRFIERPLAAYFLQKN